MFSRPAIALMQMSHSILLSASTNVTMGTFALEMMTGFPSEISSSSSCVLMCRSAESAGKLTPLTQKSTSLVGSSSPARMEPRMCT